MLGLQAIFRQRCNEFITPRSLAGNPMQMSLIETIDDEGQWKKAAPGSRSMWNDRFEYYTIADLFNLSASQILIIDCRGTPRRLASLSNA